MNEKERYSGAVVHMYRCFLKGGNSIKSTFSWDLLSAKLQDYYQVSLAS